MTAAAAQTSSADGICWDLSDLYSGPDDPAIEGDLDAALARARAFETSYRGKIDTPGGPDAAFLRTALDEFESLCEQMDRPAVYAGLYHAAKTDDPRRGALYARAGERRTEINKHLIFFDLEWIKVSDESAAALLAAPELTRFRHYLSEKRAWRPHYLSEPEEKILDEKAVTGKSAFQRLFEETVSTLHCPFEHNGKLESLSTQQILAKLYDPDREVRRARPQGLTKGLKEQARPITFMFNTVVLDHKSDCTLRKFDDPMAMRHLANEITGEVVDALMTAVERHHGTVHRYYRLKGKLLGIDTLYDYDRYAPLSGDLPACDWPTARRIVGESYAAFSPRRGRSSARFSRRTGSTPRSATASAAARSAAAACRARILTS